jgi:lysophospholipase L1-like esterase
MRLRTLLGPLVILLFSTSMAAQANAAAHESKTLRPTDGTSTTTRTYSAFGDSIAAGYCGIFCRTESFSVRHAREVAQRLDATVSYRGRAVSGDLMSQIADEVSTYANEVATADFIAIDGCGNDYLDARSTFRSNNNCTNELPLATALDTCHTQLVRALNTIAARKKPSATVVVMNLYYPGVNSDKGRACTGGGNHFDVFLDYIVESNWLTCTEALARGFECGDAFAGFNAPDFDSDGDGKKDSDEIRFDAVSDIDDFNAYYSRIFQNKHIIQDANAKRTSSSTTADYLQSDDTHPTAAGHARIAAEFNSVSF